MTPTRPSFIRYLVSTPNLLLFLLPALFWVVGLYDVLTTSNGPVLLCIPALFTAIWFGFRVYHWRKLPLVVEQTFGEMVSALGTEATGESPNVSVSATDSGTDTLPGGAALQYTSSQTLVLNRNVEPDDFAGTPVFGAYDESTDVERTVFIGNTGLERFPLGDMTFHVLPDEPVSHTYVSSYDTKDEKADCHICKKLAGIEQLSTDVVMCSRCFKPKTELALPAVALCSCASITYKHVGDVTAIETGTPGLKLGAGKLYVVEQKEIIDGSGNEMVGEVTEAEVLARKEAVEALYVDTETFDPLRPVLLTNQTNACENGMYLPRGWDVTADGHIQHIAYNLSSEQLAGFDRASGLDIECELLRAKRQSGVVVEPLTNLEDIASFGDADKTDMLPETVNLMNTDSGEKFVLPFNQLREIVVQCKNYNGTVDGFVALAESADKGDGFGTLFHFSVCGSEGAVGADDCLCPRLLRQVSVAGNFTDEMASHAELNNIRGRLWRASVEEAKPIREELMAARKRVANKKAAGSEVVAELLAAPEPMRLEPYWFCAEQHMTFDSETCVVTWWNKDERGVWKPYATNDFQTRMGNLELIAGVRHFPHCDYPNGRMGKPGCVCEQASAKLKEAELSKVRDLALYANRMNQHKLAGICFAYVEDLKVTSFRNAYAEDERMRRDFEARRQESFEAWLADESANFEDDEEGDAEAESAVDAVSDIILEGDAEIEKVADDHADVINAIIEAEERGDRVEAERLAGELLRVMTGIKKPEPVEVAKAPVCDCPCHAEDNSLMQVCICCNPVTDLLKPVEWKMPKVDLGFKVKSATEVAAKIAVATDAIAETAKVVDKAITTTLVPAVVEAAKVEQKGEVFQPVMNPGYVTKSYVDAAVNGNVVTMMMEADKVQRNFRTKPLRYIVTPDPGAVPCGVLEGGVTNTKVMLSNNNLGAMMRVETAAKTPYHTRRCSYWKNKASCSCKFAKRKFAAYV